MWAGGWHVGSKLIDHWTDAVAHAGRLALEREEPVSIYTARGRVLRAYVTPSGVLRKIGG